jgi:hypothetical protein
VSAPIRDTPAGEIARLTVVRSQFDRAEAAALATTAPPRQHGSESAPARLLATLADFPLMPPADLYRSTGGTRAVEKFVDLPADVQAAVLACAPPKDGPVVLVVMHGRCAIVGPFDGPDEARAWWGVEWNRFAGHARWAILPVPAASGGEVG